MEPTPSLLLALQIAGSQRALAKLAGVSQPAVHKWVKGLSSPGLKASVQIERATNGAVRCSDLRPDIFGPIDANSDRAGGVTSPPSTGEPPDGGSATNRLQEVDG